MGFCLFNNAAIAARYAQDHYGISRAAVVDFDVHHGNGSQDIFWADQTVMYCSTHQMPLYPGTGAASERGVGNVFNVPLAPGAGSAEFSHALTTVILPAVESFAPDLIVVSAGFDAHWRDPLASLNLDEEDYASATRMLIELADRHAGKRIVSMLEGGYDLQSLADSVAAHVKVLMSA
jgi:acetoin utilization deacetylase AcuC-like enzyme